MTLSVPARSRKPYHPMSRADVRAWVDRVLHQNIARREDRCMRCSQTPKLMRTTIEIAGTGTAKKPPDTEAIAIYWCLVCERPAFGSASYCRDRKLDFSQLVEVSVPKAQQELF